MKQDSIKISVILCTYNRAELLDVCLESLVNQSLSSDLYEIIIVDNNSTDNTPEIVQKFLKNFSNIQLLTEPLQGLSQSRNRGIKEARGEFITFIDDDAKADKDWLKKIIQAFETTTPTPAVVGGLILPFYTSSPPAWFLDEFETHTWGNQAKFLDDKWAPYGLAGSNICLTKELLEKYGKFSIDLGMKGENSFGMGEESDLFFRIYQDLPYFWYDPEIKVHHFIPAHKMTISYHIKRSFVCGFTLIKIARMHKQNIISVGQILKAIIGNLFRLVITKWWQAQEKKEFVHYLRKLTRAVGNLFAYFFTPLKKAPF